MPVRGFSALCSNCGHNVGSIYPERFDEAEPGLSFPCVKLYHARERVANDTIINSTVVVGDTRESAEYEISRLVSLHNPVGGAASGPARVQVRTTARTHDHIQRAKAAEDRERKWGKDVHACKGTFAKQDASDACVVSAGGAPGTSAQNEPPNPLPAPDKVELLNTWLAQQRTLRNE